MPASSAESAEGSSALERNGASAPHPEETSSPGKDQARCRLPLGFRLSNPLTVIEPIFRRDEVELLFVAGNVALVALEIIEWPVAAIALTLHLMARSRFKGLQVVAEVAEEAE